MACSPRSPEVLNIYHGAMPPHQMHSSCPVNYPFRTKAHFPVHMWSDGPEQCPHTRDWLGPPAPNHVLRPKTTHGPRHPALLCRQHPAQMSSHSLPHPSLASALQPAPCPHLTYLLAPLAEASHPRPRNLPAIYAPRPFPATPTSPGIPHPPPIISHCRLGPSPRVRKSPAGMAWTDSNPRVPSLTVLHPPWRLHCVRHLHCNTKSRRLSQMAQREHIRPFAAGAHRHALERSAGRTFGRQGRVLAILAFCPHKGFGRIQKTTASTRRLPLQRRLVAASACRTRPLEDGGRYRALSGGRRMTQLSEYSAAQRQLDSE
jgi:hypothetical protein